MADWKDLTRMTAGARLTVERVKMIDTGIAIEGGFDLPLLAQLPMEDQVFIGEFVRSHGSIKEMERLFGISYPTVKNRLNRISEVLGLGHSVETDPIPSRAEILDALPPDARAASSGGVRATSGGAPKSLRVWVEDPNNEYGSGKVNVRVPLNLIRAGVRLAALLPSGVYDPVNKALKENGVDFDASKVKPENLEELVQHLADLSVDVEGSRGEKVRVFCE